MSQTRIDYEAGLAHWLTVKYLKGLTNLGLLRIPRTSGIYRYYEIAPKGLRYLQVFAEIEDDLKPD